MIIFLNNKKKALKFVAKVGKSKLKVKDIVEIQGTVPEHNNELVRLERKVDGDCCYPHKYISIKAHILRLGESWMKTIVVGDNYRIGIALEIIVHNGNIDEPVIDPQWILLTKQFVSERVLSNILEDGLEQYDVVWNELDTLIKDPEVSERRIIVLTNYDRYPHYDDGMLALQLGIIKGE